MRLPAKLIAVCLSMLGLATPCFGFSLLGPLDTFQTFAIGYDPSPAGGPMNIGEGYRWNIPTITYAFDDSFLNYFGATGIAEVEKAIQILNAVPAASSIVPGVGGDPNVYVNGVPAPTRAKGLNFQAQTLGLLDLKSYTLSYLVNAMGLVNPERYVWCLRARVIGPGGAPTNYTVIQRNFDPISQGYSSFVNSTLYTYHIEDTTGQPFPFGFADAIEDLVDPLATGFTAVASGLGTVANSGNINPGELGSGEFYRGLTRDDFAGLSYLMKSQNYHIEGLFPGATLSLGVGGPWGIPGSTTNGITNLPVVNALRPGIEKVTFQRVNFDSLLGTAFALTNTWTDTYVTNGQFIKQVVQRVLTAPDILFSAGDLGVFANSGVPVLSSQIAVTAPNFTDNSALNTTGGGALAGPGVIFPQIELIYSKLGPSIINEAPAFLNQLDGFALPYWGSFDGSAATPSLYPQGSSIELLELQVTGGP